MPGQFVTKYHGALPVIRQDDAGYFARPEFDGNVFRPAMSMRTLLIHVKTRGYSRLIIIRPQPHGIQAAQGFT